MEISISSYTYTWAVGIPEFRPTSPLGHLDLLSRSNGCEHRAFSKLFLEVTDTRRNAHFSLLMWKRGTILKQEDSSQYY